MAAFFDHPRTGTLALHGTGCARRGQSGALNTNRLSFVVRGRNHRSGFRHVQQRWIAGLDDRAPRAMRVRGGRLTGDVAAAPGRDIAMEVIAMEAIALGSKGSKPGVQHPSHFAFWRPLRPGRTRTPHGRTWAVMRRTARCRRIRVTKIFPLECLPQPLQFEDQRRALRSDALTVQSADPAPRRSFLVMPMVDNFHDGTLSASDVRWAAFAAAGDADCLAAAAWPVTLRTRANTSSHGPNAIILPS